MNEIERKSSMAIVDRKSSAMPVVMNDSSRMVTPFQRAASSVSPLSELSAASFAGDYFEVKRLIMSQPFDMRVDYVNKQDSDGRTA